MAHRSAVRAGRVLLIAGIAGTLTTLVAAPAFADTATVETDGWNWLEVYDTTLGISDAEARHRDVLGSGVDLKGWTEDAFDAYDAVNGYLSGVGFDHTDPQLSAILLPTPVSFETDPAGGATIRSEVTGYDLGGGAFLDADFTLEIAGSFARWTIEVDDDGSGLVEAIWGSGELGSPTSTTQVGADGLIVTGPSGLGPIIGLHVESDGSADELDGSDPEYPGFLSTGASRVVFTLALLDYDPCAEADAVDAMAALVPELGSHFGENLEPVLSDCVEVEAPAPMKVGTPTDQLLELTLLGDLASGHPRLDGDSYFDYIDLWTSGLGVLAPDLPAGLSLEVVEHPVTLQPALRLSGTPIEAASEATPLRLYGLRDSPDFAGEMPVAAALPLEIDSLDLAAPEPAGPPSLADSGADTAGPLAVSAAAVLGGTALLVLARRRGARV